MKTLTLILAFAALGAPSWADDGPPDHINVPLADPSRPAKLIVSCINGRITVHGGASREIGVETHGGSGRRHGPERADGLRRIDTGGGGLSIDQNDNVITVNTHSVMTNADLSFDVPTTTSLRLKSVMGDINVDNITGDLEAESTNGKITLNGITGSALVHGLNGGIVVSFAHVAPDKPMSFSSLNGDIDVTLPADTRARLKMKTNNGDTYSDFDIRLEPTNAVVEDSGDRDHGRRHISIEHAVTGTINGGGPEFQFVTFNGNIKIRKGK